MTTSAPRRSVRVLVALTGAVAVLLGAPGLAAAHDQVAVQSPASGAHLDVGPGEIRLGFTEPPLDLGAIVMIVDSDSRNWADGNSVVAGLDVVQKVKPGLPDGNYQVRWRVVSSDGHPISESFGFAVGDVANAAPVPSVAAPPEPTSAVADHTNYGDFDLAGASDRDGGGHGPLRTVLLAGGGAAVGIGVWALALFAIRLRRRRFGSAMNSTTRSNRS